MKFAPSDSLQEKIVLHQLTPSGKIIASLLQITMLTIAAAALLFLFQTRQNQSPQRTESRAKADAILGQAAVEAAAAGDYDTADDFLNYVASDEICDDYSELASLKLRTIGKNDEAIAIAYKIEGLSRRDRLLEQIDCESGSPPEDHEDDNR